MENFRHSPEDSIEQEYRKLKIETYQLTTFDEIQDYAPEDMFSKAIFEAVIPVNEDGDCWIYTCKFLNIERAEEYFCRVARAETLEDEEFWKEQLGEEKVEVLNINLKCTKQ